MGMGTIVIALASIIISEVVFRNLGLASRLFAVSLGSIIYRLLLLAVLQGGPVFKQLEFDFLTSSGRLHDATAS